MTRQVEVESKVIAPSSPYASQQIAPPLTVPSSLVPTNPANQITPVSPTSANSTTQPVAPIFPPISNQPNQQNLPSQSNPFTFTNSETSDATLPFAPSAFPVDANLTPPPANLIQPVNNQTLPPSTPNTTTTIVPPPSPPASPSPPSPPLAVLPNNSELKSSANTSVAYNLPSVFVNTGLRDDLAAKTQPPTTQLAEQNLYNNQHQTTNPFNPTSITPAYISTNDPNYYSSAVPISILSPQPVSSPQQINTLFSSDMVIIEKTSQQSDISPNTASTSLQNNNTKNNNPHNNTSLIKPLPLVIEPATQNKTQPAETNERYINSQNDNKKNNQNTTNNEPNLWKDYLTSTKPNNEAVLAPARDAAGNIAARVAFAKNESSINNKFTPSFGINSADIFPNSANQTSSAAISINSASTILTNPIAVESSFVNSSVNSPTELSNPVGGVVATSNSMLIDYAVAGLDKNLNKNFGLTGKSINFAGGNSGLDKSTQNKEKELETKFDSTVVGTSSVIPTIPFVQPPIAPQPVLITNNSNSENIFADNNPKKLPTEQRVRESIIIFVTEQMRDYNTKDKTKMHSAFVQLSKLYDRQDLSDIERDYVAPVLDRMALELIYSAKYHVLEPMYCVKAEDTIESIARKFSISPFLLSKINGLNIGERLVTGSELKVVHGQFDAKIHTKRGELTLLLGGVYAGRFPVVIGRNVMSVRGEFIVQNKNVANNTKILTLNNGITLNGLGQQISQNSLGVSQENIEELFDILTENSVIIMEE
ncbi:MAG: LysM peptidoglycan-binding domain-containing protein [Planctomycetaceae bacterium]|nr:LysM peptidoglycan-binding domain-containing protein [Planctomycetaceae bacterium]